MSYTPINWQTGDIITADKLNRCDNGWSVITSQLFSETVTTAVGQGGMIGGQLAYSGMLDMPSLVVTFNGTDYECQRIDAMGAYFYGGFSQSGPDFSEYPFAIQGGGISNFIFTETDGTYAVAAGTKFVEVSDDFGMAVGACVDTSTMPLLCVDGVTTFAEMRDASNDGRMLYFKNGLATWFISGFSEEVSTTAVSFMPDTGQAMTAGFDSSMVFTVYFT